MGDSMSKYHEDIDEWESLRLAAGIVDVEWKVYSAEARHAKAGYNEGLAGDRLKLYVKHAIERDELKRKQENEISEYELYLELKEKFK